MQYQIKSSKKQQIYKRKKLKKNEITVTHYEIHSERTLVAFQLILKLQFSPQVFLYHVQLLLQASADQAFKIGKTHKQPSGHGVHHTEINLVCDTFY